MEVKYFTLVHKEARRRAKHEIDIAPDGYSVRIGEGTRSSEQNAMLHACLTDIADQVEWCGKKLPMEVWKRLTMAAYLREQNEQPQMIPALDGQGFDVIFERTSKLSRRQFADLITWCLAFGNEQGVRWSEPKQAEYA